MKRALHMLAVLAFIFGNADVFAQQKGISGTVKDSHGEALLGVNIIVQGTAMGTITDVSGKYALQVPASCTLVFSFVGFRNREVEITSQSVVDIVMEPDVRRLNEVVITALNIERNTKALHSSVTQIDGDNFTQARENSLPNALAARIAGVNVTKVASGPAGSTRIVIRGAKSLGGTSGTNYNQPLYVVDGVPLDNSNMGQAGVWGDADWGDGMRSLNPDDIESITVLKGAASAALYGSRAATGVILITTKKGQHRKGIGIEYNSNLVFENVINYTGWQQKHGSGALAPLELGSATLIASKPTDSLTGFTYSMYDQAWGPRYDGSPMVLFNGDTTPYAYGGDNWSRFYKTGPSVTNSMSLTGGSETQNFRASVADLRSTGTIPNSGFERLNLSLAINSQFREKFTFLAKMLYSDENVKNRPRISDSPGSAIQAIYRIPGDQNVYDYKGDPNKLGAVPQGMHPPDDKDAGEEFQATRNLWGQNPYWVAYQYINSDKRERLIASGQLRYDINDFLYLQFKGGMDGYTTRATKLTPEGTGYERGGLIFEFQTSTREINLEWVAGFNKAIGKFRFNTFLGGNRMRRSFELFKLNGTGGFNVAFHAAINNAVSKTFNYYYEGVAINSLFTSGEISFNDYLFVTATARKDWFSTLHVPNNNVLYPSVGASLVFSDAITTLPLWLSFGKIRVAWAQVGDASSVRPPDTQLAYTFGPMHLDKAMGFHSSGANIPNPVLRPLRSEEVELGVDIRFLENRIGLDVTYYSQKTTDDIIKTKVSEATGFLTSSVNIGKIQNKGLEVLLTGSPVKRKLSWDISLNFAMNDSKVVALLPGQNRILVEDARTFTASVEHIEGHPFGMITGLKRLRDPEGRLVFLKEGLPQTSGNYEILGNGVPRFTGGLNNSVTYKQFNLSFLVDFKTGFEIYSGTNSRMTLWGFHKQTLAGREGETPLVLSGVVQNGVDDNKQPIYEPYTKTLTPVEAVAYWARFSHIASDHFVYDASFIKIRQLTLGYIFSRKILKRLPINGLELSFVGRNLAILYRKTENIDPESSYTSSNAQGLDYFGMPPSRTFGFNLNATF